MLRSLVLAATVALALVAPAARAGVDRPAAEAAAASLRPTLARSFLAEPVKPVWVRSRPGGRRRATLRPLTSWGAGQVELLVLDGRRDARGRLWLQVRLLRRPNAASAWAGLRDHVRLRTTTHRIVVRLGRREVLALRGGRVIRRFRAVVGRRETPTLRGFFAVAEAIRQPAGGFLGAWALHLSAHSTVLEDYGGGPGRVAIHGRGGASPRPLGSAPRTAACGSATAPSASSRASRDRARPCGSVASRPRGRLCPGPPGGQAPARGQARLQGRKPTCPVGL
jgi:hypothetical protein